MAEEKKRFSKPKPPPTEAGRKIQERKKTYWKRYEARAARSFWVLLKIKRHKAQKFAKMPSGIKVNHMEWSEVKSIDRDYICVFCNRGSGWCVFLPEGEKPEGIGTRSSSAVYGDAKTEAEKSAKARAEALKRKEGAKPVRPGDRALFRAGASK